MQNKNKADLANATEDNCSYGALYENLDSLIREGQLDNRRIILFGAGLPSRKILEYLQKKRYAVHAVIDNNKSAWGTKFEGLCITSPEGELTDFQEDAAVLIASSHHKAMREQLENLSCSGGRYVYGKHIFNLVDYEQLLIDLRNAVPEDRKLSLPEVQRELLEILKYVKRICEENNLTYFLCYGTLLGAVRHEGFIPWDDDLDVTMPCEDYKKLLEIVREEGIYGIQNAETDHSFKYNYSQLLHPSIYKQKLGFPVHPRKNLSLDIFPLYSVPDDAGERQRVLDKNQQLKNRLRAYSGYDKDTQEYLQAKKELLALWDEVGFKPAKEIHTTAGEGAEPSIYPYETHRSSLQKKFCDDDFAVPAGWDEVLRIIYHDYMKLPPEPARICHSIYWRGEEI